MRIKPGEPDSDRLRTILSVRSTSGQSCRVYVSVSLLVLFTALSLLLAHGEDQWPAKDSRSAARKIVYQVYQKQIIILGEVATAGGDRGAFHEANRKELRNELERVDASLFAGEERTDLGEWRDSLVELLDKLPDPGFDKGLYSWQVLRRCMTVLADHDITGALAKEDGYPQLAEKIDALHDMAKEILLVQSGQDTKALQDVTPVTRVFVEYLYIFTTLVASKNRDPIARCALLSMKPGEIKDEVARTVFLDLHQSLLPVSRGRQDISKPFSEAAGVEGKRPLVFFCDLVKKSSIHDAEIEKAKTDERLCTVVKQLREISKADRCGSILP